MTDRTINCSSHNTSFNSIISKKESQNSEDHLPTFAAGLLGKNMVKDTDEQLNKRHNLEELKDQELLALDH